MQKVIGTRERIESFIERHKISGKSEIVDNTSKVYSGDQHKTVLRLGEKQTTVYSFANPKSPFSHALASILWWIITHAEDGGYYESYARWRQEAGYSHGLSAEEQKALYAYNRQCYRRLMEFLGEDLYRELAAIERGSAS